jgi:hypothetical protein
VVAALVDWLAALTVVREATVCADVDGAWRGLSGKAWRSWEGTRTPEALFPCASASVPLPTTTAVIDAITKMTAIQAAHCHRDSSAPPSRPGRYVPVTAEPHPAALSPA